MRFAVGTMVAALSLAAGLVPHAPAEATGGASVTYCATGCDEVAVLTPTAFAPGDLLLVLVYECDRAVFGDEVVAPFVVSEIGVVRSHAPWTLLRWTSNSRALTNRMQALGMPASFTTLHEFTNLESEAAGMVTATVRTRDWQFAVTGTAAASVFSPAEPDESGEDGAAFQSSGERGTAELRYRWDRREAVPGSAQVVIDATKDAALSRWMGADVSRATGVYSRGDWTGTARLLGSRS